MGTDRQWRQLIVEPQPAQLEALEAWLSAAGALALTLQDAGNEPLLEPAPGTTPLWRHTRLVALFDEDSDMAALTTALRGAFPAGSLLEVSIEMLADRAWELEWRRDFRPMRFGRRLWVTPEAMQDEVPPDAVKLLLEPGLAFGTGTHPTTALCLRWLDAWPPEGRQVLDYGCGSGILAVAAAKLGAAEVHAVDIDPQAILATRENARRNAVALALAAEPPALGEASYDVVMANIIAGTLASLAGELSARCRPGGHLVLSGILTGQIEGLQACFAEAFQLLPPVHSGDWCLLHGIRRADRLD